MEITYTPEALADLARIPDRFRKQILRKIGRLQHGLHGDIKRLQATEPIYRLRSGDYRVIFAFAVEVVDVLRVKNRREAYD